jgi:DNA-binding ferritin-like protein
MVRYREGHKNSKGEDAPWCIVSHENGRVISSHKSKREAEKHLGDIQMFKNMKNEAMVSPIGFKNRVVEILSNFDQFKSKIWRQGGRVITVNFRTAQYEEAEELGKLMTRALNRGIPGYKAELVGVDHVGSEWFADIKFKKEDKEMTIEEAKDILSKSGKKTINESYLEQVNVEELYSLALEALFFADQVHLWHWTCKSGFHHTHLQEVYESLRDFADELVEICLASGKKFQVKANTRELGGDGEFDVQDAIDELEEFIDQIQATATDFEDESEITTLIDDEAKALTKELGLLKSFS